MLLGDSNESPNDSRREKAFRGYFPNLDVDKAVVTGGISSVYNCISWTVGVTDRWIWPGNTIGDFDAFYRGFGYVQAGDGPIAAWGHSNSKMTHGCVSDAGHGPRWESKCGYDLRIQHGLNELIGGNYGRVVAFFRKSELVDPAYAPLLENRMTEKASKSYLTSAEKKQLRSIIKQIPSDVRSNFEKAFKAWKDTWFAGGLAVSSNPHTRSVGNEFDVLVAMGSTILPLLIEKLADPENFLALQLYDAMQPNEQLVVHIEPTDERILEGEQGRARRVVRTWFKNQ